MKYVNKKPIDSEARYFDGNKKIEGLREKFFKECCDKYEDDYVFHSDIHPVKLFDWFKPYLQGTIDWEGACSFAEWIEESEFVMFSDYWQHYEKIGQTFTTKQLFEKYLSETNINNYIK